MTFRLSQKIALAAILPTAVLTTFGCRSQITAITQKGPASGTTAVLELSGTHVRDGQVPVNSNLTLSWESSKGYSEYSVQLSRNADCTDPMFVVNGVKTKNLDVKVNEPGEFFVCLFGQKSDQFVLLANAPIKVTKPDSGNPAPAASETPAPSATPDPPAFTATKSTTSLSANIISSGESATVTFTAMDQYGKKYTDSNLDVSFALATGTGAGSSTGTFSAVQSFNDGTYVATFTGATPGTATFIETRIGQATESLQLAALNPAITVQSVFLFEQPAALTVAEGATSETAALNCSASGGLVPVILAIANQSDNDANCSLTSSPTKVSCQPNYKSGHSDWNATVTLSCSDGMTSSSRTMTVNVTNTNRAPNLTPIADSTMTAGNQFTFDAANSGSDADSDGDALLYSCTVKNEDFATPVDCTTLPGSAAFNTATGALTWNSDQTAATGGYARRYTFNVTGSDQQPTPLTNSITFSTIANPPAPWQSFDFNGAGWSEFASAANVGTTVTQESTAAKRHNGVSGLQANVVTGSSGYVSAGALPSAQSEIATGAWIFIQSGFTAADTETLRIIQGGSNYQVYLTYSSTAPAGWRVAVKDGTGITTSSLPLRPDSWNHVVSAVKLDNTTGYRKVYIDGIERGANTGVSSSGSVSSLDQIGATDVSAGVTVLVKMEDLKVGRYYESVQPAVPSYNFETTGFGEFFSQSLGSTVTQVADAAKNGALGMRVNSVASTGSVTTHSFGAQQTLYIGFWYRMPSTHSTHAAPASPYVSFFRSPGSGGRPDGWLRYWGADGAMKFMWHNAPNYDKSVNAVPADNWRYVVFGTRHSFDNDGQGTRHVFVDGVAFIATTNINNQQATMPYNTAIGAAFASGGMSVLYDIDDVRIGHTLDSVRPAP